MTDSVPIDRIRLWREKPQVMVRELFGATPDPWQDKVLEMFPHKQRIAMKASRGPGKTTVLAWLAINFLLTRPKSKIAATSISSDNLRDGLWSEFSLWSAKSDLVSQMFTITTERIFHKESPNTWFMAARSWSKSASQEQLGATLAGLHADYIMFLLDETGAMPVPIAATAEAALSSAKEAHIIQAGNTNTLDGALYHACVTQAHLWEVVVVNGDPDDPLRSPRVSLEWARDMIAARGRDDPFVKVSVLGEWPAASINALLGPEDVEAAFKRHYHEHEYSHAARILGVDVARETLGDESVIFPRQGLVAFTPKRMRGVDGIVGAGQVARTWQDWDVDAAFIDNTGGFGASWIDQLKNLGRSAIPVGFAQKGQDPQYYNRRAEMYHKLSDWVKAGGALPRITELVAELSQTCYTHKNDMLLLEPKDIVKVKLGRSPDLSDALALTFAEPVQRKRPSSMIPRRRQDDSDYSPFRAYMEAR